MRTKILALILCLPLSLFAFSAKVVKISDGDTITVLNGNTWAYVKYSRIYVDQEKTARENKRGLWQSSNPTTPWEWRKR